MAGPILSAQTGMGEPILILTLVVIVIGGIGSVRGAFLAALMVRPGRHAGPRAAAGLLRAALPPAAANAAGPAIASMLIYVVMALVLALRPGPVPRAARMGDLGMLRFSPRAGRRFAAAGAGAGAAICAMAGRTLPLALFGRVLVYGIAALALNLLLGYGGMVSFGHALYLGLGAYAVGVLNHHGIENGWLHLAAALAPAPWSAWSAATWRCAPPASPSS